jgi:hypothetical protein
MGVDYGFDIYPLLERTRANQERYELFLREVLVVYGPQDGDDADRGGGGDGGSVVRVDVELEVRISSSWLANIHACSAGTSTSCGSAPRSAAGRSLSRTYKECARLQSSGWGAAFTFGMRWTSLACIFATPAAITGTRFMPRGGE